MWSAIHYSPYNSDTESVFALNGTYRKRLDGENIFEWGLDSPTRVAMVSAGASTGLTGDYNAKYTFCRKERNAVVCESNPSLPDGDAVTLANNSCRIRARNPLDPQVNCIRFYRTVTDGATYYYDQDLNYVNGDYACTQTWEYTAAYIAGIAYRFTTVNNTDNTEDCYTWEVYRVEYTLTDNQKRATSPADNICHTGGAYVVDRPAIDSTTADGSLGTEVTTTNNRPPLGTYVAGPSFNGISFIIKDNKLYFSKSKQPEYWPETYYIDVSPIQYPGKCVVFHNERPYYLNQNSIYYIAGTGAASFLPYNLSAKTGTQGQQGAVSVHGFGIFHVGPDGIYLCMPSTDQIIGEDKKITGSFEPIFRGESVNDVPACGDLANAWLRAWENKLYFGYPGTDNTYPKNVLVFHLDTKRVGYFNYPSAGEIHTIEIDRYNNRLLVGDENGYVWEIEDKDVTDDSGTAIAWEVESKDFTLQTRRHFPRWVKYDVDASNATSATGELLLDGSSKQSHTLSGDRDTRRRLVASSNGKRCSHKISGSGPVEIYMIESQ
jgi:hypothetical protein